MTIRKISSFEGVVEQGRGGNLHFYFLFVVPELARGMLGEGDPAER
jgi:hypothetical protein